MSNSINSIAGLYEIKRLLASIFTKLKIREDMVKDEENPEIRHSLIEENNILIDRLESVLIETEDTLFSMIINREIITEEYKAYNYNIENFCSITSNSVDEFWHRNQKYFLSGTYKMRFSAFGIESIKRTGNEEGQIDESVVYESDEEHINGTLTFKNDECILCIDNKPNILFCNCGHICICNTCNELYLETKCPVCKFENNIRRKIN